MTLVMSVDSFLPLRYIVSQTPQAHRRPLSASATVRQTQVTVCRHVPEVDDTVGGKPPGVRRERHPDVDCRVCPQPEVRIVGHPGRVAVGRSDLPLADEGARVAQAASPVYAYIGPDATAKGPPEREREPVP